MNREIKFRAWDEKRKKMLIGDGQEEVCIVAWSGDMFPMYCSSSIDGDFYSVVNFTKELWHRDIKLMQYTGLKDKNGAGKEVYIEDIARDEFGNIFEIKDNYAFLAHLTTIWFEVIGNIHENGDLLK